MLDQAVNAVLLTGLYSLVAVGFTLFFGVLDLANFAHGEVAMLGAFVFLGMILLGGFAGSPEVGLFGLWLAALVAIVGVGGLGVLLERAALRPIRSAPPLLMLLATVGVSIVLRETVRLVYPAGANPQTFPRLFPEGSVHLGSLTLSYDALAILLIVSALIMAADRFINRTRVGASMRAIAQDREAAMMMGVDLDRTISATFFLGSILGAVAGVLNGAFYGIVRFDMGLMMAVKGFSAAVVGGLGSFYGALVGSAVLAFIETAAVVFVPMGSQLRDVFSFAVVIAFLIFRPTGIFSERVVEKV